MENLLALNCNWSHLQTSIWTLGNCRRHLCRVLQSEQWLILPLLKGQRLYYFLCLLFSRATTRKCPLVACMCCCSASHQVPRPGVASPLLLFSSIQQLAHWLTGRPTADFKNPANRLSALLLLVPGYCCFLWACLSTDVIKNRKGLNFNRGQKKSWNRHVLFII